VSFDKPPGEAELKTSNLLELDVERAGKSLKIYTTKPHTVICAIVDFAKQKGLEITSLTVCSPPLEDVFVRLTGVRMSKLWSKVWAITEKDILMYYSKGPVVIFGVLFPVFLLLAFYVGRELPALFLIPGLLSMTLFFTATPSPPAIAP